MPESDKYRGPSASLAKMPFIVSSGVDKVDPVTRRLIRSHARRGKGRKRGRFDQDQRLAPRDTTAESTEAARLTLDEVFAMYASTVPDRVGSDVSFLRLADEIELPTLLNMTKVSAVIMRTIFPLQMAIGFHTDPRDWLIPMARDAAGLHITAFAIEEFITRFLRRRENVANPTSMLHFHKGLRLLQQRLLHDDDETKISDSTISIVLKLVTAAHFSGNHQASKQHMVAIRKMVDLRGGVDAFTDNKLLVEMFRCDLGIALHTGCDHVFFRQPSEPVNEYPEELQSASDDKTYPQRNIELVQCMRHDLATAWHVMGRFCMLVNLGTQTQRLVPPRLIHETMTAVIYRLLHMRFAVGSLDEAVRYGLLAFSYHIFLQWKDVKLPYDRFPAAFQHCIQRLRFEDKVSSQLMLWLLMTGATSIFSVPEESWVRENLEEYVTKCRVETWKDMHEILKSFMWIALLDEQAGKDIFGLLQLDGARDRNC